MSTSLPIAARRRLLAEARARLSSISVLPIAAIPVSHDGWQSALSDAGLIDDYNPLADAMAAFDRGANAMAPNELRTAALTLATETALLVADLWYLAALLPSQSGYVASLRDELIHGANKTLDALERAGSASEAESARSNIRAARQALLESRPDTNDDPCAAAFGILDAGLRDARGVFMLARVLAGYYGRYDELQRQLNHLLSPITSHPPDLIDALRAASALILTPRPLITLRVAVGVYALLNDSPSNELSRLAQPLRHLKLRVDRSAASHAGIVRTTHALSTARSDAERAGLALDLYRRMAEGQLRPWAWTLLQIRGRQAAQPPELSTMRDQLIADGHPFLLDAARAILPKARNAAAHEDYVWNEDSQLLAIGEMTITLEEVNDATERAHAFMCGAECGWACARAASPELGRLLDAEDPAGGLRTINEGSALSHFGTNGLHVRDWSHERGLFSVALETLTSSQVNPCFQAIMWASRHLSGTGRFQVTLADTAVTAMDLQRAALDATFVVWRQARATFEAMPPSTFLPANAWARLAVELPDDAARAAAWLGLVDAVAAYDTVLDTSIAADVQLRATALALRLELVAAAVTATMAVLPPTAVAPLQQVIDLVLPAAKWAGSVARGAAEGPSRWLEQRIRLLEDAWPAVAILPTVDPRPLGDS